MPNNVSQITMQRSISADLSAIGQISAVPSILQVVSETTGLRFVTIARVTEGSWIACAVLDKIAFGLEVGGELDVATTLCSEIRDSGGPIIIEKASEDAKYCGHPTPRMYGFESYIATPIFRRDGEYFGTLCALDPQPAKLSEPKILSMMNLFAELISVQLDAEEKHRQTRIALHDERGTAELREQFIAVLGHDLRNPIQAISAGAGILLRQALDPKSLLIADHIRTCSRRMSRLVDDILDLARGRLGNGFSLDLHEVPDLEAALLHVIAELQSAHPDRIIRCDIAVPDKVRCDRDRVAQLLSNLLANALAHGASDLPVDVIARRGDGSLVLAVTNQGAPIPPETIPRLFQPYWRPATESPHAGLGLGLYIVAEIARAHGGRMDVSSTAERGTTFTFTLPTPGLTDTGK
jgi:signal transduction histidine kinase